MPKPRGGHPFPSGYRRRLGARTKAVRDAARKNIRKAQSVRFLAARGERHTRRA